MVTIHWSLLRNTFHSHYESIKSFFCSFYMLTLFFVSFISFIGGTCIYFLEKDYSQITFLDALFITVSSSTGTGLMTVDIYFLKVSSQFLLSFCTELCGVSVASCAIPAFLRIYRLSTKCQKEETEMSFLEHHKKTQNENDSQEELHEKEQSEEDVIDVELITSEMVPYKYNYQIEMKAISIFALLCVIYIVVFQCLGFLILTLNCNFNSKTREALVNDGVNPTFYSFFVVISAWNNVGSTVSSSSFDVTQDYVVMITMTILCIMGLIGLPLGIRFFVFLVHRLFEPRGLKTISLRNPLLYALKSPTRISNFLFSASQTRLLLLIFIILVVLQTTCIVLFNRDESLSDRIIILALIQSSVTRTSGFTFLDFKKFNDVVSVVLCFTMFVGSYPIQIIRSIRDQQVNIESGLSPKPSNVKTIISYFKDVFQSHAMIIMVLSLIIMAFYAFDHPDEHIALTAIFEITSGFGTVGYSLGCSTCDNFSFSGVLPSFAKCVVIFSMIIGRVRGYPYRLYPPDYYDSSIKKRD